MNILASVLLLFCAEEEAFCCFAPCASASFPTTTIPKWLVPLWTSMCWRNSCWKNCPSWLVSWPSSMLSTWYLCHGSSPFSFPSFPSPAPSTLWIAFLLTERGSSSWPHSRCVTHSIRDPPFSRYSCHIHSNASETFSQSGAIPKPDVTKEENIHSSKLRELPETVCLNSYPNLRICPDTWKQVSRTRVRTPDFCVGNRTVDGRLRICLSDLHSNWAKLNLPVLRCDRFCVDPKNFWWNAGKTRKPWLSWERNWAKWTAWTRRTNWWATRTSTLVTSRTRKSSAVATRTDWSWCRVWKKMWCAPRCVPSLTTAPCHNLLSRSSSGPLRRRAFSQVFGEAITWVSRKTCFGESLRARTTSNCALISSSSRCCSAACPFGHMPRTLRCPCFDCWTSTARIWSASRWVDLFLLVC